MIQDIAPHKFDNAFQKRAPKKEDFALYYEAGTALILHKGDGDTLPRFKDLESFCPGIYKEAVYLFRIDEEAFFLILEIGSPEAVGGTMESTQIFRELKPDYLAFAGITGYQLHNWYCSNQYCGCCGEKMVHDEKERMVKCPNCGHMVYPKICPAVIVGITDGNRLLMSKYAGRTYKKYALIAGFTEIGESMEDTVRREVMEEVGLEVEKIRFYKSQPWSFSDTLLLGFFADLKGKDTITLDEEELAVAEWFEREEIPVEADGVSLTNEMIMAFKNGVDI